MTDRTITVTLDDSERRFLAACLFGVTSGAETEEQQRLLANTAWGLAGKLGLRDDLEQLRREYRRDCAERN